MKIGIFFALLFVGLTAFSQTTIKGQLLDSVTRQPVEFANIGLIGKGYGTVSNERGEYEFVIPDSLTNEKIRISIIGYANKTLDVAKLRDRNVVLLEQIATNLGEISITAKKTRFKVLGNETQTKAISAGFTSNNLGAELAVKLRIKQPQTQIRKVVCNINKNTLNKNPVFRLNIYKQDAEGYPGENILKENIIIEPKEMTGLIQVDLTPYNIVVDDDTFISLEWIKDLGDVKGLYFSSRLIAGTTYYRLVSQDKWRRNNAVGIGLYAEVAY